ncbi:MmcQ/YjbR family DNA-binding protein [Salipaludibacillus sp. LMS25]|uniref:MmcQ/YjbR family DNA-binding protein n=1 Tax=Salipaludibacillus sp. LMS25 TaxID=2924031 RepID=UPI0020D182FC|nr:MmcQ/YjbR family DNA-binding protein [Salipaludibacillus sp. LMS25]UTR15292.1 MmcQ/YjbR family DNA-binding protein [Salipaludibacillus sp. LMS25]
MNNLKEVIDYCLGLGNAYKDKPFRDKNWTVIRHIDSKKVFAWIFEKDDYLLVNVKDEPDLIDLMRQIYPSVVPGFHLNKDHWNSIILDGTIPKKEIHDMIRKSYLLTKRK